MATTQIADVIIPEVFNPYVIERSKELSALYRSGIATPNAELDKLITGGGKTIHIPAFKDLTGDDEVLSDSSPLTPAKMSTKEDIAAVLYRGKAWSNNELAGALSGTEPAKVVGQLVAEFWARKEQAILVNILNGIFGATSMANLTFGGATTYYDGDVIVDGQGLLGDAAGKLSGFIMHSAVRNDLLKKDKTAFQTWTEKGIEYNKYLGYDVIVDDGCPVADGVYTSYLFAQGAVSLGTGTPNALTLTETDRDSLQGNDVLINRRALVVHPNGMKWKGTPAGATPSNAELATATNWERVSEIKNMGIVQIKAKLGTAPATPPQTGG